MAIDKKFIHFNKLETFKEKLEAGEILPKSIVFIADAKLIYLNGTYFSEKTLHNLQELLELEGLTELEATDTINEAIVKLHKKSSSIEEQLATVSSVVRHGNKALVDKIKAGEINLDTDLVAIKSDGTLYIVKDKVWEINDLGIYDAKTDDYSINPIRHIVSWGDISGLGDKIHIGFYGCTGIQSIPPLPEGKKYYVQAGNLFNTNIDIYNELDWEFGEGPWTALPRGKISRGSELSFPGVETATWMFSGAIFDDEPGQFVPIEEWVYADTGRHASNDYVFHFPDLVSCSGLFSGCTIKNLHHIYIDAPNLTSLYGAFAHCTLLNNASMSSIPNYWSTMFKNVTNATFLFAFSQFISLGFQEGAFLPNCQVWHGAFKDTNLHSVYFAAPAATNMKELFRDCVKLARVTITELGTLSAGCAGMFRDCRDLYQVKLNMTNVTNTTGMFTGTFPRLTELSLTGLKTSIDLSGLIALSKLSIEHMIDNAQEVTNKTITLCSELEMYITDELKEKAAAKGWSFAFKPTTSILNYEATVVRPELDTRISQINETIDTKIEEAISNIELPGVDTSNLVTKDEINVANGVAGLDGDGKVSSDNLPIAGNTSTSKGAVYSTATKSSSDSYSVANCIVIENTGQMRLLYYDSTSTISSETSITSGSPIFVGLNSSPNGSLSIDGSVRLYDHTKISDSNYTYKNLVPAGELNYRLANLPLVTSTTKGIMSPSDKASLDKWTNANESNFLSNIVSALNNVEVYDTYENELSIPINLTSINTEYTDQFVNLHKNWLVWHCTKNPDSNKWEVNVEYDDFSAELDPANKMTAGVMSADDWRKLEKIGEAFAYDLDSKSVTCGTLSFEENPNNGVSISHVVCNSDSVDLNYALRGFITTDTNIHLSKPTYYTFKLPSATNTESGVMSSGDKKFLNTVNSIFNTYKTVGTETYVPMAVTSISLNEETSNEGILIDFLGNGYNRYTSSFQEVPTRSLIIPAATSTTSGVMTPSDKYVTDTILIKGSVLRQQLKEDLFRDMWQMAGLAIIESNGDRPYIANDYTELTYDEAVETYVNSCLIVLDEFDSKFRDTNLKAILPLKFGLQSTYIGKIFVGSTDLESVSLYNYNGHPKLYITDESAFLGAFDECSNLKCVRGELIFLKGISTIELFDDCPLLEEVRIYPGNNNVYIANCPKLSYESIKYMINGYDLSRNRTITITVHEDVFLKLLGEYSELEDWKDLVTLATKHNVEFVTL